MTAKSMHHWNAHQMVVMDVETTGTRPYWHEVVQFAAVALDARLQPRKDILPFDIYMCPEHPERVDPEALKVTGLKLQDLLLKGHNQDSARDMFERWTQKLELGQTVWGSPKRIIPLAHNWAFDKPFIQDWMGYGLYDELIDSRFRDTMTVSLFLNDWADFQVEKVPYSKNKLSWLASKLGIEHEFAHNALQDCLVTAEVYRRLCQRGLMA
jgi:DNA polymerase III epsilon subunit-like protein